MCGNRRVLGHAVVAYEAGDAAGLVGGANRTRTDDPLLANRRRARWAASLTSGMSGRLWPTAV